MFIGKGKEFNNNKNNFGFAVGYTLNLKLFPLTPSKNNITKVVHYIPLLFVQCTVLVIIFKKIFAQTKDK